jgi:hypothetical protein
VSELKLREIGGESPGLRGAVSKAASVAKKCLATAVLCQRMWIAILLIQAIEAQGPRHRHCFLLDWSSGRARRMLRAPDKQERISDSVGRAIVARKDVC